MDNGSSILSLSAPSSTSSSISHNRHNHRNPTTVFVSFSLKPPSLPLQPPQPPPEPNKPSNPRLPNNSVKPSSPLRLHQSKISSNPLKTLLQPSYIPSSPKRLYQSNNASTESLSSKLRLSSKLSPPPPPPPPPPPVVQKRNDPTRISENPKPESREPEPEFRQDGKIFVGNLPTWTKKHEVVEFFRQFGPIQNVILIRGHNETEKNAGFGFVIYGGGATAEKSAAKAVEFDGIEFHGRVLTVKLDDGKKTKTKAEERAKWVEGEDVESHRSTWHQERDGSQKTFRKVLETEPENWQAVVTAFDKINKVWHSYYLC